MSSPVVRVVVRVQTPSEPLRDATASSVEAMDSSSLSEAVAVFDASYPSSLPDLDTATPDELFVTEVAPLAELALAGRNAVVLFFGADSDVAFAAAVTHSLALLLAAPEAPTVDLACVEVDGEHVRDSLATSSPSADLAIRQRVDGAVVVPGLSHRRVATVSEGEELWRRAHASARRSHHVVTLNVKTTDSTSGSARNGKLHLVNLARLAASGAKMATSIGLFVLGRVMAALNTGGRASQRVPFRESKLARLLQGALGSSSSRAVLICSVSLLARQLPESLQTLAFASHARGIATVNASSLARTSRSLASQVASSRDDERRDRVVNTRGPDLLSTAPTSEAMKRKPAVVVSKEATLKSSGSSYARGGALGSMESKLAAWRAQRSSGSNANAHVKTPTTVNSSSKSVSARTKRRAAASIGGSKPTPVSLLSIPTASPLCDAASSKAALAAPTRRSKPVHDTVAVESVAVVIVDLCSPHAKERDHGIRTTRAAHEATPASEDTTVEPPRAPRPKKARLSVPNRSKQSGPCGQAVGAVDRSVQGVRAAPLSTKPAPKLSMCADRPASNKENEPVPSPNVRYASDKRVSAYLCLCCVSNLRVVRCRQSRRRATTRREAAHRDGNRAREEAAILQRVLALGTRAPRAPDAERTARGAHAAAGGRVSGRHSVRAKPAHGHSRVCAACTGAGPARASQLSQCRATREPPGDRRQTCRAHCPVATVLAGAVVDGVVGEWSEWLGSPPHVGVCVCVRPTYYAAPGPVACPRNDRQRLPETVRTLHVLGSTSVNVSIC